MFPGLGGLGGRGGMSPKKMKGMLKNMGINIDEIENVLEVVIRLPDKEIIIENASVAIMDSHGVRSYQISGDSREQSISGVGNEKPNSDIPDSDVELVMVQTGANKDDAKAALQEAKGDLAEAIMKLKAV